MSRPRFIRIDLSNVTSALDLHSTLRDSLGFPGWYGCNWMLFGMPLQGLSNYPRNCRLSAGTACLGALPKMQSLCSRVY
ncbi:barstar family protein [Pseudomonas tohonis]|uniref:barstar family protein n=1 Tax=Pseudomonas tohonis TaxID=2725477 RepID=UPI001F426D12|nr:barstar family protein [Pseudomonas tohonis]